MTEQHAGNEAVVEWLVKACKGPAPTRLCH